MNNQDDIPLLEKESFDETTSTFFSIGWLELEVLKILTKSQKAVYKGEMISKLRNKYPEIVNKPESSFYAIFDRLQEDNLVTHSEIKGEGYKKFLSITQNGLGELNRALNWGISTIFEGMIDELITVLNKFCVNYMGCMKEYDFGIISPNNPEFLVPEMCNKCVNPVEENIFHRFNILLPYSKDIKIDYYQNLKAQPNNIPLKDNFLQRVLSVLSLGLLEDKQSDSLLEEMYRILQPGGKAAIFEIMEFESYLFEALSRLTQGFDLFVPKKVTSSLNQFSLKELQEKVGKIFGEENVEVIEMREIIFLIATK